MLWEMSQARKNLADILRKDGRLTDVSNHLQLHDASANAKRHGKYIKIALVVNSLYYGKGGLEQYGVNLAAEMAKRGHEVAVFSSAPKGIGTHPYPLYPLYPGVTVYAYPGELTAQSGQVIKNLLREFDPDVCVPMFSWKAAIVWPYALYGTGIPYIFSEHNYPPLIENERWSRAERLATLVGADAIHLLHEQYRRFLPDELQERVTVISNAVPPAKKLAAVAALGQQRMKLLCVGRLIDYVKQYSKLIRAFALLMSALPNWDLHLVGEGSDQKLLEALINSLGLGSRVLLCGFVENIEEEYASSHLFCIPSRSEGSPSVVLEALAHGLPVVGFADCPGVNCIISDKLNGLLAPEMTEQSLAESLSLLMSDDILRMQYAKNAFETVNQYTLPAMYDKWENLLLNNAAKKNNTIMDRLFLD